MVFKYFMSTNDLKFNSATVVKNSRGVTCGGVCCLYVYNDCMQIIILTWVCISTGLTCSSSKFNSDFVFNLFDRICLFSFSVSLSL